MISFLFSIIWFGCGSNSKTGSPVPIDVPIEIDSVTVIPAQGVRSDSYMQCVPSIRGADYETLEIRYSWFNETTQQEIGVNYDLTLTADMVDVNDELRCVIRATDASGDAAESYDAVFIEQVIFPLSSALAIFDGEDAGDRLGGGVARLGDVDGDGEEDFALGAPYQSDNFIQGGKVYLMKSFADEISDAPRSFGALGNKHFLGLHIASAGYIDADARPDLFLGATGVDENGVDSGAVYLYTFEDYWYTGSREVDLRDATQVFYGEETGDKLGSSMVALHDLDGDGLGDFALASAAHSSVGYRYGRVYVHLSSMDSVLTIDGNTSAGLFGYQMANAGDVDGDGLPELWVSAIGGSSQKSSVYLFSGADLADGEAVLSDAQLVITASEYATDFGAVLKTGDIDGDGFLELFVAAPLDNTTGYQAGAIYVFSPARLRDTTSILETDALFSIFGEGPEHKVGSSLALLADRDGDNGVELLIGAPGFSGQYTASGKIYYLPSKDMIYPIEELTNVRRSFVGEAAYDEAGKQLTAIGDLDGDGLEEILISAPSANGSSSDSGRVYLISGILR